MLTHRCLQQEAAIGSPTRGIRACSCRGRWQAGRVARRTCNRLPRLRHATCGALPAGFRACASSSASSSSSASACACARARAGSGADALASRDAGGLQHDATLQVRSGLPYHHGRGGDVNQTAKGAAALCALIQRVPPSRTRPRHTPTWLLLASASHHIAPHRVVSHHITLSFPFEPPPGTGYKFQHPCYWVCKEGHPDLGPPGVKVPLHTRKPGLQNLGAENGL